MATSEGGLARNIFCFVMIVDHLIGTIYTDSMCASLAISHDGNQYFFIAYAYNPNDIYVIIPLELDSNDHIIAAFSTVFMDDLNERATNQFSTMSWTTKCQMQSNIPQC